METKSLGKIDYIKLGAGGYQEACFGLSVGFKFDVCCGIADFKGSWYPGHVDPDKHTKWTEQDRMKQLSDLAYFIAKILREAKKDSLEKMVGVPVELTLEDNSLKSWRILTEVI